MSTAQIMERSGKPSPHPGARFVGAYYLLTLVVCAVLLFFHGRLAFAADLITAVFYIAVTALFCGLCKQARRKG